MDDTLERLGQTIRNALGASVAGYTVANGELTVNAKAADIVSVAKFLRDDPACQFEADVHRLRPDVEEQITRRRRGVMPAAPDLDERMQLGRAGPGEQQVPRVGADRGHHREAFGRVTEADGAHQSRDVAERVVNGLRAAVVDGRH